MKFPSHVLRILTSAADIPHRYYRYASQVLQVFFTGTAYTFMISRSISTFTFQGDSKSNFSIILNALEKEPSAFVYIMRSKIDLMSENNVTHIDVNSAEEILFTCTISINVFIARDIMAKYGLRINFDQVRHNMQWYVFRRIKVRD